MQTESPNHRGRFQFSLRDLFALVALAALACAILFPLIRERQRIRAIQEKANEVLKALVKPVQSAASARS